MTGLQPQSQGLQTWIGDVAETPEQIKLANAVNEARLSQMSVEQIKEPLSSLIALWNLTIGKREELLPQIIVLIGKYVIEYYPQLTLSEIKLAIDLSVMGKLNVGAECYDNFSPMYVSKILNSYLDYKGQMVNELNKKKARSEQNEYKPIPQSELDLLMLENIKKCFTDWKKDRQFNDWGFIVYDKFRDSGVDFEPYKESATTQANIDVRKYNQARSVAPQSITTILLDPEREFERLFKMYSLGFYFDTFADYVSLLQTITPNEKL